MTVATAPQGEVGRIGFKEEMLPAWRLAVRRPLLRLVEREQTLLVAIQKYCRTPQLDVFFTYTTNLGTHTFFLLTIPLLFWCGYADIGRGLAIVMTLGVFMTGFVKDLFCLPRPFSPPVHRLTFSKSHSLEYGFPSTHTSNAVAIGLFLLAQIDRIWPAGASSEQSRWMAQLAVWLYMASISFGRLYCGMHGLVDVSAGGVIGLVVYRIWQDYWPSFELWLMTAGLEVPLIIATICIALIVLHPDPAEPCPCIDDSICVCAVDLGMLLGTWNYSKLHWPAVPLGVVPFNYATTGILGAAGRVVFGIFLLFVWRLSVKYVCYQLLPPLYRVARFPYRKFYTPATDYKRISASDIELCPSIVEVPTSVVEHVGAQQIRPLPRRRTDPSKGDAAAEKADTTDSKGGWQPKPRYDVDIVTKTIVYAGIGWFTAEGIPLLFPYIGLA